METFREPNFSNAVRIAQEVLINVPEIKLFPFSSTKLIQNTIGINCMSYSRARDKLGLNPADLGSDSAILTIINGRAVIFYNDLNSKPHIKYSILHEMAHLLLGHVQKDEKDEEYSIQEIEANFLVSQILMPDVIINEFIRRGAEINVEFLMKYFEVSKASASKKIRTLGKNSIKDYKYTNDFEEWILLKYEDFINEIYPDNINNIDWIVRDYEEEEERDSWR